MSKKLLLGLSLAILMASGAAYAEDLTASRTAGSAAVLGKGRGCAAGQIKLANGTCASSCIQPSTSTLSTSSGSTTDPSKPVSNARLSAQSNSGVTSYYCMSAGTVTDTGTYGSVSSGGGGSAGGGSIGGTATTSETFTTY